MDHFDPTRPYLWSAVECCGNYAGPADASTAFDTGGFVNPIMGSIGWRLDPAGDTLSLIYTPFAVPEAGTLALTTAGLFWAWRGRRWAKRRPAAD